jgi:hypothetical protein
MGTGSFPGVKYGWGVQLTTHPLLVPLSWKSRAIPLPTLWATTGPVTGTLYLFFYLLKVLTLSALPFQKFWKMRLKEILFCNRDIFFISFFV